MSAAPNAPRVSQTDTSASVPDLLEVIEQKDRLIAEQQKLLALMEEQLPDEAPSKPRHKPREGCL